MSPDPQASISSSGSPGFLRTLSDGTEAYYQVVVAQVHEQNLRTLRRIYSSMYGCERAHAEWIDLGGEA